MTNFSMGRTAWRRFLNPTWGQVRRHPHKAGQPSLHSCATASVGTSTQPQLLDFDLLKVFSGLCIPICLASRTWLFLSS